MLHGSQFYIPHGHAPQFHFLFLCKDQMRLYDKDMLVEIMHAWSMYHGYVNTGHAML